MTPIARLLPDGQRLHLQHGPSDLIVWAEGDRQAAYRAATARFQTVIAEIMQEIDALREGLTSETRTPHGAIGKRMHTACIPFTGVGFVTRMAAVAGAVADEVLAAMTDHADLTRAYVNNGGDIALHIAPGQQFTTAMLGHDGRDLGRITLAAQDGVGGIATSGRHGRSLSLGIADSVTVLAASAAQADAAATLVANAVDLPRHSAITRRHARDLDETSDLGLLPVVTGCGPLCPRDAQQALDAGRTRAMRFQAQGLLSAAALFLQGQSVTIGAPLFTPLKRPQHEPA